MDLITSVVSLLASKPAIICHDESSFSSTSAVSSPASNTIVIEEVNENPSLSCATKASLSANFSNEMWVKNCSKPSREHLQAQDDIMIEEDNVNLSLSCASKASSSANFINEIWVKNCGKPSLVDLQARDDIIALYGSEKYRALFNDKKSTKKKVWDAIAEDMKKKGYSFGGRDPGKVCSQKWRNMEAETLKVMAAAGPKNSGGAAVKKPDYFEDICDIVKDKAKACPKNLLDSLEAPTVTPNSKPVTASVEENIDEEEQIDGDVSKTSPFLKVKTSSHPKKNATANEILEFLKNDAAKRDQQNAAMLNFFRKKAKKDDKRKKSFLSVLQDIAGSKKRKIETSDEDTSSESEDNENQTKK